MGASVVKKPTWVTDIERELTSQGVTASKFCEQARISTSMWCRWMQGTPPTKSQDQLRAVRELMVKKIPVDELILATIDLGGPGSDAMKQLIETGYIPKPANKGKRTYIQEVCMRHQLLRRDTLTHFGMRSNPFIHPQSPKDIALPEALKEFSKDVIYGITQSDSIIAIRGRAGSGKTTFKRWLINELSGNPHNAIIIEPDVLQNAELNVAALHSFIISKVGSKDNQRAIHSDAQRRGETVIKSLANKRGAGGLIVVLIDEFHTVPKLTTDTLKVLNDATYNSWGKLVHLVLFGQHQLSDVIHDAANDQFEIRTAFMDIPQMSDCWGYISHRFRRIGMSADQIAKIWPPETVEVLTSHLKTLMASEALTPVYIQNLVIASMNYAAECGQSKVLPSVIEAVLKIDEKASQRG